MDLDVYKLCPCGSGKKIKFCCCNDILSELDKVVRTMSAGQHVAALDQIARATAAKGQRDALQIIKSEIHLALGDPKTAAEAVRPLYQSMPTNPTVLCYRALVEVEQGRVVEAFQLFQEILKHARTAESVPSVLGTLFQMLVQGLIQSGEYRTARALLLHRMLVTRFREQSVEEFRQIERRFNLPLLLRYPFELTGTEGTPNQASIDQAIELGLSGQWQAALAGLEQLRPKLVDAERLAVHRMIARLAGWLPRIPGLAEKWHQLANSPGITDEEAVEAEATAQLFNEKVPDRLVDELRVTIPVRDMDRFMERCLSSKRLGHAGEVEPSESSEPPPKAHFILLSKDRDVPSTDLQSIPLVEAEILVYGRQTDREARVEITLPKLDDYEARLRTLADIGGDALGDLGTRTETVEGQNHEFGIWLEQEAWIEPIDADLYDEFEKQKCRRVLMEKWPDLPNVSLEGKSPKEVAHDPAFRLRLQGAILNIELLAWGERWPIDANELRRKLGVPESRKSAFESGNFVMRPLARLARVEMSVLPTEVIADMLQTALIFQVSRTLYDASSELLQRDPTTNKLPMPRLNLLMLQVDNAPNTRLALQHVLAAQEEAAASNGPVGFLRVRELSLRLNRMEQNEIGRLIQTIANRHGKEPETMQMLYQLLSAYGLVREDDNVPQEMAVPAGRVPTGVGTAQAPASPLVLPGSAAPPPEGRKSRLILPGMD